MAGRHIIASEKETTLLCEMMNTYAKTLTGDHVSKEDKFTYSTLRDKVLEAKEYHESLNETKTSTPEMDHTKCPNDGEPMHFFNKPMPIMHLGDPNNFGDCDWETWEEDHLGYLIAVCLKCDYFLGIDAPDKEATQ